MSSFVIRNTIASALLLGGALACSEHQSAQKTNAPTNVVQEAAATVETRSATESIAESRCQREERCENVGESKKYSSMSDCLTRIRADWKDDLNARECPGGVKDAQLDECLGKIRAEECNSPFDTLSRVAECTSGQICKG
ncbi:MAG: DUF6184 family natural product biosynthesis lipoprotein [Polyangiaceae bacterium]